jgi:hypothetical protein
MNAATSGMSGAGRVALECKQGGLFRVHSMPMAFSLSPLRFLEMLPDPIHRGRENGDNVLTLVGAWRISPFLDRLIAGEQLESAQHESCEDHAHK